MFSDILHFCADFFCFRFFLMETDGKKIRLGSRAFNSYLSQRKQYISIKNCNSSMSNITLGAPQGLVLGPVLFLLYINDMYSFSNQMRFVHFADDTTVFAFNNGIDNVHATVNRGLVGVDNWLKAIRLTQR